MSIVSVMNQPSVVASSHSEPQRSCVLTGLRKVWVRFSLLSVMLFLVSLQAFFPAQAFASEPYVALELPYDSGSISTIVLASAFTPRLATCCGTNCDRFCTRVGCRRCRNLVAGSNPYADATNRIYDSLITFLSTLKGHR